MAIRSEFNGGRDMYTSEEIQLIRRCRKFRKYEILGVIDAGGEIGSSRQDILNCIKDLFDHLHSNLLTGHGDWCFNDGYITLENILNLWHQVNGNIRNILEIGSDCCYSGKWFEKAERNRTLFRNNDHIWIYSSCASNELSSFLVFASSIARNEFEHSDTHEVHGQYLKVFAHNGDQQTDCLGVLSFNAANVRFGSFILSQYL
ncbi:hypothetical protein I4U23_010703 [Adineta vaga]|nr:hypothetical protein I4U23_010703 [Adineta vaga]